MKSYLIKDTTKEERIELIKEWQEPDDCVGGSGMDLFDTYQDYINGIKEISEINQEFHANYISGEPEKEGNDVSSESFVSTADEIIKLKSLLDQGVLSADEFAAAKRKLLNM